MRCDAMPAPPKAMLQRVREVKTFGPSLVPIDGMLFISMASLPPLRARASPPQVPFLLPLLLLGAAVGTKSPVSRIAAAGVAAAMIQDPTHLTLLGKFHRRLMDHNHKFQA